jgi:predicted O-methyltransferase YrrM
MNELKELLSNIWYLDSTNKSWDEISEIHDKLKLPELTGGVNPGDQRAIYYLIKSLDVKDVLEIGTHVGCSTVSIALSLNGREGAKLTTVDVRDVNVGNCYNKNDQNRNLKTPKQMIEEIGCSSFVDFVVSDSVEFLNKDNSKYDFIFLDGDHSYDKVYKELPIAVNRLNEGGVILFHDYFQDYKPLWHSSTGIIEGPFRAVTQLINEGLKLFVHPCGELPNHWKCKYENEFNTSLAVGVIQE